MLYHTKMIILKLFHRINSGCKIGRNSFVDKYTGFDGYNYVGANCNVRQAHFGRFSYVANGSKLNKFRCGNFCSIGSNVNVGLGEHPVHFLSTHPAFYGKHMVETVFDTVETLKFDPHNFTDESRDWHVYCGNDVWIGNNVIIKDGVVIGDGAIIGANSLVLNDIEPYSISHGTPATPVSYRFEKKEIAKLLKLKWWNWDDDLIIKNISYFKENSPFMKD